MIFLINKIDSQSSKYCYEIQYFLTFQQNDGEVDFLEVQALDNSDQSYTTVWALSEASNWAPVLGTWNKGEVKIEALNEEREYQVSDIFLYIVKSWKC